MTYTKPWVLQVKGTSMRPWLWSGDCVLINPCSLTQARIGDIIVARSWKNNGNRHQVCVHRLVWKNNTSRYLHHIDTFRYNNTRRPNIIIKGDSISSLGRIRLGADGEFLGKVVNIVRNNQTTSMEKRRLNLIILLVSLCLIPWQLLRRH